MAASKINVCPVCDGKKGWVGYDSEWSDCPCCRGGGKVSERRRDEYRNEIAALDAEIEKAMADEERRHLENAEMERHFTAHPHG